MLKNIFYNTALQTKYFIKFKFANKKAFQKVHLLYYNDFYFFFI